MGHDFDYSEAYGRGTVSFEKEWEHSLSAEIRGLPSVQNQIAERAYHIYLNAGLPQGAALEHWLAAENEADSWIHHAISCISAPLEAVRTEGGT